MGAVEAGLCNMKLQLVLLATLACFLIGSSWAEEHVNSEVDNIGQDVMFANVEGSMMRIAREAKRKDKDRKQRKKRNNKKAEMAKKGKKPRRNKSKGKKPRRDKR